jgi:hypothetical protein
MAGDPSKIRTQHLPNTNQNRYRYANPLGEKSIVKTNGFINLKTVKYVTE